jgi:SPOR domain
MLLVMSAQAHTQSGRFIRVYLLTWGLLAAVGLTYLASLAWHVDLHLPQRQQQAAQPVVDPEQGLRVANRALAEIDNVQHTVGEMQKDLGRLKETVGQRDAQDRESQSRLAALEEKVSTLATPPVVVTVPSTKQKSADKAKGAADKRASEQRATSRIISVVEEPKPEPPAPVAAPPKLETGSIPAAPPVITFGEPEVTPARQAYTVQLGAGPSLDALRMNWLALRDQHGGALGALQPRYVAPRNGNGPYRLVAGPLATKADADKVCAEMGMGRDTCFATTALGQPL